MRIRKYARIYYFVGKRTFKISPFFISVAAAIAVTCAVIIFSVCFGRVKITFKKEFYFVYYSLKDNSVSAAAVSESVFNLGGAGYVLEYNGNYYVTVSCYYNENDADSVRQSLFRRGIECSVLKVETEEFSIKSGTESLKKLYSDNLNTLYALSQMCYECANGLDYGNCSQSSAQKVLSDIESGLKRLKNLNPSNCFTGETDRLSAECAAAGDGFIYSKSMRKLQIAIIDSIINADPY